MQNKANRFWVFYNSGSVVAICRDQVTYLMNEDSYYVILLPDDRFMIELKYEQNPSFEDTLEWLNYKTNDAANIEDAINDVAKDIKETIWEVWQAYVEKDRL